MTVKGEWFLVYFDFVNGLGAVERKVLLSARKEYLAKLEVKTFWENTQKRVEYISRSPDADIPITFPHSPRLVCVLACVIDPLDKGGQSESETVSE
jgi:hypothetical protein